MIKLKKHECTKPPLLKYLIQQPRSNILRQPLNLFVYSLIVLFIFHVQISHKVGNGTARIADLFFNVEFGEDFVYRLERGQALDLKK